MTDEELKKKLLEVEPVTSWWADRNLNWPRNPEGPQAVARIEKLEAARDSAILQAQCWKIEAMSQKASLHSAYQHITGSTGEPADWHGANPIIEAFDKLKAQPFGAIHTDGSRSGGQPIKGTNDG